MGFRRLAAAYGVVVGTPSAKAVLVALAWHACEDCSLAWPGRRSLAEKTEIGERRISSALAELVKAGHLTIFRYPFGGRGVSTEYVVLPQVGELSTAPCGECRKRMKNPAGTTRFSENREQAATFSGPGNAIPSTDGTKTAPPSAHQQSVQLQQSALAKLAEVERTGNRSQEALENPTTEPAIPETAKDALRALGFLPPPETREAPRGGA